MEFWSDLCGLFSGFALLVTAWRNDGLYGFIDRLKVAVKNASTAGTADAKAAAVVSGLEGELSKWTWIDRWALRAGALFLIAAFVLKMVNNA